MFKIREYKDEYKNEIVNLWIKICVEEFGFTEWKNDLEKVENQNYIRDNGIFLVAIGEDGNVVGTISLKNVGSNIGMIKSFYVREDYRAQKLGLKLMNELVDFAIRQEYKELVLDTYEPMRSAIRFYQKYGFKIIEQIEDRLVMSMYVYDGDMEQVC